MNSRACRGCGCTELDCSGCIARTGAPCSWVDATLCSACDELGPPAVERVKAPAARSARGRR